MDVWGLSKRWGPGGSGNCPDIFQTAMPKLSQADIKAKADEWADLGKKITKAEEARDADLEPHRKKYESAFAEVGRQHDPKIEKLQQKRDELQGEIIGWLNAQGKAITLEATKAIAAVETKVGSRVIDPHKFFEKAKSKGAAAWDCVTVAIAKAEKLLGKTTVDEISTKDSKLVASLKLK